MSAGVTTVLLAVAACAVITALVAGTVLAAIRVGDRRWARRARLADDDRRHR